MTGFAVCATNARFPQYRFTGKERDTESGNDYFGARYYASSMGRWLSPDQLNLTDARILNPANTLNKYAYGANNPLGVIDPDGRDIIILHNDQMPAGHFAMVAYNQETGGYAVKSFGPQDARDAGTMAKEVFGGSVPGKENFDFDPKDIKTPDDLRSNYMALTIQTSPEVAQEAINFIASHPSGDYNLYTNNCTSACAQVLKDLGIISGGNLGPWTPGDLWQKLYTSPRYSPNGQSRSAGHNQGTRGNDYGRPRFGGMDTFDFLYLLLNRKDNSSVKVTVCNTLPNGQKDCF